MKKKLVIISSICVILLIALVGGTLAWFYVNEEVSVSYGNSIFCEAGDSLEIALVEGENVGRWSGSIDYSAGEFTAVDITGNGVELYRPAELDEYQMPVSFVTAKSTLEDTKNYDYIEMEVAFRSISKMNVYLSEESFIQPVNTRVNADKPNIYGNFSRDYIAGAMRVAVLDETGTQLKMLWAPNSKYQLIQNANGTFAFKNDENGGIAEQDYYFFGMDENGDMIQQKVSAELYANKQFVIDSTGANLENGGNSPVLVSLNPQSEGVHAQDTVKIRIWFEGTDREAHQALAGGNVNIKLKFVGIAKETDTTKQAAVDALTLNQDTSTIKGIADGMWFSTDGRTWVAYNSKAPNLPVLESGSSIFIKYPETDTHYETTCKKLTKN